MPGSEVPLLEVRNLTRRFGGLRAVDDLSFRVSASGHPRPYRPKRCWKDDNVQSDQRLLRADQRADLLCRSRRNWRPHQRDSRKAA